MKYSYTIKKDPEKGIYFVNEHGAKVAATDILDKCGEARVFAFDGKMGAGKTTFIKCLCEAMGTEDVVNSPTFAIVNVYEINANRHPNEFRGRPAGYSLEAMQIRTQNGKQYVLCAWRRRYVRLTPEELVRQTTLQLLVDEFGYPHNLIAVEVPIEVAGVNKRCDAIVYNRQMQPLMLIEFKAPSVHLTQEVFDQAAIYNRTLHVPMLMLCNGRESIVAQVLENQYQFLPAIPQYQYL